MTVMVFFLVWIFFEEKKEKETPLKQVKEERAILDKKKKRHPASLETKKYFLKDKQPSWPISQKHIHESSESLFDENYREELELSEGSIEERIEEREQFSYFSPRGIASVPQAPIQKIQPNPKNHKNDNSHFEYTIGHGNTVHNEAPRPVREQPFNPAKPEDEETNGPQPGAIICKANRESKVYTGGFKVEISCNRPGSIYFCLSLGAPCDPNQGLYSGEISVGPVDGDYYLSYYGMTLDGRKSFVVDDLFTIDSTLPSLMTSFPKVYFQTSEVPLVTKTQSLDFGKENHFYSQYNFLNHNPLSLSCADILSNYGALNFIAIETNFNTSFLNESSEIEQQINISGLHYGENYIVTALEDRNRYIASCDIQRVILRDFSLFAFSGASTTTEERPIHAHFTGYSYFEEVPNIDQKAGSGSSLRSPASLKEGFVGITN